MVKHLGHALAQAAGRGFVFVLEITRQPVQPLHAFVCVGQLARRRITLRTWACCARGNSSSTLRILWLRHRRTACSRRSCPYAFSGTAKPVAGTTAFCPGRSNSNPRELCYRVRQRCRAARSRLGARLAAGAGGKQGGEGDGGGSPESIPQRTELHRGPLQLLSVRARDRAPYRQPTRTAPTPIAPIAGQFVPLRSCEAHEAPSRHAQPCRFSELAGCGGQSMASHVQ